MWDILSMIYRWNIALVGCLIDGPFLYGVFCDWYVLGKRYFWMRCYMGWMFCG